MERLKNLVEDKSSRIAELTEQLEQAGIAISSATSSRAVQPIKVANGRSRKNTLRLVSSNKWVHAVGPTNHEAQLTSISSIGAHTTLQGIDLGNVTPEDPLSDMKSPPPVPNQISFPMHSAQSDGMLSMRAISERNPEPSPQQNPNDISEEAARARQELEESFEQESLTPAPDAIYNAATSRGPTELLSGPLSARLINLAAPIDRLSHTGPENLTADMRNGLGQSNEHSSRDFGIQMQERPRGQSGFTGTMCSEQTSPIQVTITNAPVISSLPQTSSECSTGRSASSAMAAPNLQLPQTTSRRSSPAPPTEPAAPPPAPLSTAVNMAEQRSPTPHKFSLPETAFSTPPHSHHHNPARRPQSCSCPKLGCGCGTGATAAASYADEDGSRQRNLSSTSGIRFVIDEEMGEEDVVGAATDAEEFKKVDAELYVLDVPAELREDENEQSLIDMLEDWQVAGFDSCNDRVTDFNWLSNNTARCTLQTSPQST